MALTEIPFRVDVRDANGNRIAPDSPPTGVATVDATVIDDVPSFAAHATVTGLYEGVLLADVVSGNDVVIESQAPTGGGTHIHVQQVERAIGPANAEKQTFNASGHAAAVTSVTNPVALTEVSKGEVASAVAGHADFVTLFSRFTGITSLANWLRAMTRKSTADATALAEINNGGGAFNVTRDSLEAQGAKTRLLGSGNATTSAPVADNGTIPVIYQGDDYAGSRVISFTFNSSGYDIASATSLFEAEPTQGSSFAATGTIADNGDGTATAAITITSAQSALLETGPVYWSALNITSAGLRQTITSGDSPLERKKH